MNQPGSVGGWGWKLDEIPSLDLARRLRAATEAAGRLARAGVDGNHPMDP